MKVDKFLHGYLTKHEPTHFVGHGAQGALSPASEGKSGSGGKMETGITGPTKPGPLTVDAGKSGTGGKNDWASISAKASAERKL